MLRFAILLFLLSIVIPIARCDPSLNKKYFSPNGLYSIEIIDAPTKGIDRLLVLKRQNKVLIEKKTVGSLLSVCWSPDKKYVAVNNRTAVFGDYLWVLSLSDGRVVRKPDDYINPLKKDPYSNNNDFKDDDIFMQFTLSNGWNTLNQLIVREDYYYKNNAYYLEYVYYCQAKKDQLIADKEEVFKKKRINFWPPGA